MIFKGKGGGGVGERNGLGLHGRRDMCLCSVVSNIAIAALSAKDKNVRKAFTVYRDMLFLMTLFWFETFCPDTALNR